MELEMLAHGECAAQYAYELNTAETIQIVIQPLIKGVVRDLIDGASPALVSTKFHHTLVHLCVDLCAHLKKRYGLNRVVLSGGVFQNGFFMTALVPALETAGFEVFTHRQVPANDGGIALGQAVAAAAMAKP
jgi:hydrogenase maturation protein HypF